MSNRKQRLVFGILATLVGALAFEVASAYIVSRDLPPWLALAVGALAFPVGPVTWHLLRERSRKKQQATAKTPSKSTLTGGDRYWLRFVVVVLLVIGPMVAIGKLDVARAVWRHGLWWWPTSYEPTTSHGAPLSSIGSTTPRTLDVIGTPLARVPYDAELVVLVQRSSDDKWNTDDRDGRAIFAWGDRQLMLFVEGTLEKIRTPGEMITALDKVRGKMPWLPTDEVSLVDNSDSRVLAASAGWRALVESPAMGPSSDVLRELGRAPRDALLAAGFVPKTTRDVASMKAGAAWLYKAGDRLVVEGRIEANDEAAAKTLLGEATRALDRAAQDAPRPCREQAGAIIRSTRLDQTGVFVTGRLEVDAGSLMAVIACALGDR